MEKLQRSLKVVKSFITRTRNISEKLDETHSVEQVSNRLQKLEENYASFVYLSQELYDFEDKEGFVDPCSEIEVYEKRYFEANSLLQQFMNKHRDSTVTNKSEDAFQKLAEQQATLLEKHAASSNAPNVHLAQIKIPPFTGKYQDWTPFKDLFQSAVDSRTGLTSTQKFYYLVSCLEGEALNLVKHIAITESNYVEAWDRLVQRYERKPLIIKSFVQSYISLPSCTSSNAASLRKLTDSADEAIRGLKALNANNRDPWLIQILINKLDDETKHEWAKHCDAQTEATFEQFFKFLTDRCDSLESCANPSSRNTNTRRAVTNFARTDSESKCALCHENHFLSSCQKFKGASQVSRRTLVKEKNLCYNCLSRSHTVNKCSSKFQCRICSARHHTLLHADVASTSARANETTSSTTNTSKQSVSLAAEAAPQTHVLNNHSTTAVVSQTTLLPTICASVVDNWGNKQTCRILVDTGSTVSFVTEPFAQRCGFPRSNARIPVTGLSSCNAGTTRGRVQFTLLSDVSENHLALSAFVLPKLTTHIPTQSVNISPIAWKLLSNLTLADRTFNHSSAVDVLLGSDYLWNIYTGERKILGDELPLAIHTTFGWIVAGQCAGSSSNTEAVTNHAVAENIEELFRSFMELEAVQTSAEKIDANDPAEVHFAATHTRASGGSYVVKYPFRSEAREIGETLPQALTRFNALENRLRRNNELRQQYTAFMREYLSLGHMQRIPLEEIDVPSVNCFYLPHHAVLSPDSTSTKCRVVFDGSCKDSYGVSLNERMHIGQPIQRDLFAVCLRFRQHKYAFSTDVQKMFRGIFISQDHTDYQRIVWRESENSPIEHFRLLTVTYGIASSPFLSVRVLKQISEDYKHTHPNAVRVLLNDAYVDDIPTGSDTIQGLIDLKDELIDLLAKANLNLRKWSSNCWPLLDSLPNEICEFDQKDFASKEPCVKLLGLQWKPCSDELSLKIKNIEYNRVPTKRTVLSEIAKIFDPLGLAAPTTVLLKILLQEVWAQGLNWDDELPAELRDRWKNCVNELPFLANVKVPRYIYTTRTDAIELHCFADASAAAYAAVIYSRAHLGDAVIINILTSKTRVAPLKPVSIPRLELSAALLLTKLVLAVKDSLTIPIADVICWSDSQIVLDWLSSPPRRWKPFVCNRTAEILDVCPRSHWRHVRSEDNPADCASRGLLPSNLLEHSLWWTGPRWLSLPSDNWPKQKQTRASVVEAITLSEEKQQTPILLCAAPDDNALEILINKISSYSRLVRTLAYCQRFIARCRLRSTLCNSNSLTTLELQQAAVVLMKYVQQKMFASDIRQLQQQKQLHAKSQLIRYSPFLDQDGVLRVGGHLKHATLHFNIKHPILVPKSNLCFIILRYLHIKHLHTGVEATFAIARQQYWILGCRNIIRKVVFACKTCFMQRRATSTQLMGQLPEPRIQPTRCFLHCGLDYAGPVSIKLSRTRNAKIGKAWFAIFICMSTKAIHIELVSDLTPDAFIAAFRRFAARRGHPSDLYSDNGTTFHGARRHLDELHQLASSQAHIDEVTSMLAMDGVHWHFIPPSAPHFGGLWESGVRSIKLHLRRVVGHSTLTFEEYYTILTQIEALLNSRPLCAISDTELDPLTPAHFMIGAPYTAVPEPTLLDTKPNQLNRWQLLQSMVHGFWNRWRIEYLTSLQQRPKWQNSHANIKEGDLVVIKEPSLPPSKWLIGRVTTTFKSDDNLVRVVQVKTARGEYKRPITKIALLPNPEAAVQGGRDVEE